MNRWIGRSLSVVLMLAAAGAATGQSWPARPVRVIVSSAAGGTPDIVARLLAERESRTLGQQVLVDNRPGATNLIGAEAAARAPADGYTMFFVTAATLVTNPYTFKSLPYDPDRDFVPVAMVGKTSFMVLVNPQVPAKNLRELVALDRAQPGTLSIATDGTRNFSGMISAWLNKLAGAQIQQVPYQSMPQGVRDTVANRTQVVILAVPSALPFLKRADLRPLAVTTDFRVPGFPDVPPVAETFAGFNFLGWFAMIAPRGTPEQAVQRVNQAVDEALKDPQVTERLADLGVVTYGAGTPKELADFIQADRVAWGKVVKAIGIEPE